jgi:uracil-DNA glycosylase
MSRRDGEGTSAREFLPHRITLGTMTAAVERCRGCPLYRNATRAVFGEGAPTARVILVGEQPGNDEDLAGRPFVGPAGRVLDEALEAAGIARGDTYVTNVVKHFSWVPKGKRRIHKTPTTSEVNACLPWLEKEIEVLRPRVLVCLGATAAKALLGRGFRVSIERGRVLESPLATHAVATVHPSSILRQRTSEDRHRELLRFTDDLRVVARLLGSGVAARDVRAPARTK